MPVTTNPLQILSGQPGVLYHAQLLVAAPTPVVTAGVFSDTWPVGWNPMGPTDSGTQFSFQTSTANVEVAEQLTPVKIVTTGKANGISFALAHFTATNLRRMQNAGTGALTTTGAGATTLTKFTPTLINAEVRCQIGWQSDDNTVRVLCYQTFQTGNLTPSLDKGNAKATLNATFSFETPSSGIDYEFWFAGPDRV